MDDEALTPAIVPVTFESIAAGGDGVGRAPDGRAVFAPGAAPGDRAEVEIESQRASFARGRIVALQAASPLRVPPPCQYYPKLNEHPATACGGCQIQHLNYEAQLAAKRGVVRDALKRIGGLHDDFVRAVLPSPLQFGYRNKGDFVVGLVHGHTGLGFFARNSHDLVDIENCLIQSTQTNRVLEAVRCCVSSGLVEPFDAASGRGVLRRLLARTGSDGSLLAIAVTTDAPWNAERFAHELAGRLPSLVGVMRRKPRARPGCVYGRDWLEHEVAGLRLKVTGEAFFQINPSALGDLVETTLSMAAIQPGERMLDLFCGVGLFSLAMARAGAGVTGVEFDRGAIDDARFNAAANSLEAHFMAGDAARATQRFASGQFDCVLLDPPRAGAAACVDEVIRLRPKRIVYVSCEPATLARDAARLTAGGYTLTAVQPIDLFPQTAHIESVALLEANSTLAA